MSSDFSPWLRQYEPHVRIGADADAFVAHVQTALAQPGDPQPRRRVAAEHSWQRSTQSMVELFEELWSARRGR